MTEDELVADLSRLLREGLVMLDVDPIEEGEPAPRFRPTARGVEELHLENAGLEAS